MRTTLLFACFVAVFSIAVSSIDAHAQQQQASGPPPDLPAFHITQFTLYGAAAADLATTWIGLSQGRTEANPVLGQSRISQGLIVGGSTVALTLLSRHLYKTGHRKVATVLNALATSEHTYAAWHNGRK